MANEFTSINQADVSNSWELLYEGAGTGTEQCIASLKVANIDGTSSADIYIAVTNEAASDGEGSSGALIADIAHKVVVPAGETVDFGKVFIEGTNEVWVKASATGDLAVYGSLLKIT